MKVTNNSKIDITVCKQIISINKSVVIDNEIWKKEYHANAALRDAVNRKEIIVKEEKSRRKK